MFTISLIVCFREYNFEGNLNLPSSLLTCAVANQANFMQFKEYNYHRFSSDSHKRFLNRFGSTLRAMESFKRCDCKFVS